jgi:hypothetical protein
MLLLEHDVYRGRRRLASDDVAGGGAGGRKRKRTDADVWRDAVEVTIELVGWAKRDMRREGRHARRYHRLYPPLAWVLPS